MNKEEVIARYGEEAWEKILERNRAYCKAHREELKARHKRYYEGHPEQVIANQHEGNRKGGKHYDKKLIDNRTGLRGARNRIRSAHRTQYKPYKDIIAPESQLHHEWIPNTADYRGVALVEADAHMHGIVDVIQILDGKITLLTEAEIRKGRKK